MSKFNCVLLIDDDGTTNHLNEVIVKKLQITNQIHTETNGEKGLNFLQYYAEQNNNNAPELILLDIQMPVLDGIEFLEYLRIKKFDNKDKIKVVVLASNEEPDEIKKFKSSFSIIYLEKPLSKDKLMQALT